MAESNFLNLIRDQFAALAARIDRIEDRLDRERQDASESRRRVYEKLEQQYDLFQAMEKSQEASRTAIDERLGKVESAIETNAPTLKEFRETKQQVMLAGALGRHLWKFGVAILAAAGWLYSVRHDVAAWWNWFSSAK